MRDLSYSDGPIKKKIEHGSNKDNPVNVSLIPGKNSIFNSSYTGGNCGHDASIDSYKSSTTSTNSTSITTATATTNTTSSNEYNKTLNKSIELRILVVEANHDLRNLFQTYLNWRGLQIKVVDSGNAALINLLDDGTANYDVVIINTHLPDKSGLDVAREIHKKTQSKNYYDNYYTYRAFAYRIVKLCGP
jgi:CheY-like chemotaxis protein